MGHIFVSYSRSDTNVVDRLVKKLEEAGYKVWVDREGIQGGDQWRRQIVNAIENSEAFIIALSPNSVKSENVRKELDLAEGTKTRILPVEIQPVTIPSELRYQLVGLQRIDLTANFDTGFMKLLNALGGSRTPLRNDEPLQSSEHISRVRQVGLSAHLSTVPAPEKSTGGATRSLSHKILFVISGTVLAFVGYILGAILYSWFAEKVMPDPAGLFVVIVFALIGVIGLVIGLKGSRPRQ